MNVLITGARGFLGLHLYRLVKRLDPEANVIGVSGRDVRKIGKIYEGNDYSMDLRLPNVLDWLLQGKGPFDCVYHIAGHNGGIAFNAKEKARIFNDNTKMALNVLDACARHKVNRVVSVVASCSYPQYQWHGGCEQEILDETSFLDGPPHPSVACHAYAKRNLQLASQFYHDQYGLDAVCLCPTTLYGPGDSYDPQQTKVVGAMVKRFVDAVQLGQDSVTCWGTGQAKRELLYVQDAAELIVQAGAVYDRHDVPLNLGTGQEVTIKKLASLVASCVEYRGKIKWNGSDDGALRKRLDLTRMKQYLPPFEPTPLEEGLLATVADYLARHYSPGQKGKA